MAWYSKIVDFFKTVKVKVSAVLVSVLGEDAAHKLGEAALEAFKSTLGVIVMDAVIAVEGLQIGSDAKRAEAFKKILTDMAKLGISASTSLINLLIELAVQRMKGNIVPVEPPVVEPVTPVDPVQS